MCVLYCSCFLSYRLRCVSSRMVRCFMFVVCYVLFVVCRVVVGRCCCCLCIAV